VPSNPINFDGVTEPAPAANDENTCGTCDGNCDDCNHCDACGDCITRDGESNEGSDGNDYCEPCWSSRFFDCADCGYVAASDHYSHNQNADGAHVCEVCVNNYCSCDSCGSIVCNDDSIYRESRDATYCERCDEGEEGGEFDALRFDSRATDTFDRIGSRRTFGIELETSDCDGYTALNGGVHFGACEDGSIRGMEFVSDVLFGDRGLDAVNDFCGHANRKRFAVDSSCGFHLHIGCTDLSERQLYAVAAGYACLDGIFNSFVPAGRRTNTYCGRTDWTASEVLNAWNEGEEFADFAHRDDRYQWLNLLAYRKHRTIEVRLHTATLNPVKVNNWVMLHLRFTDAMAQMSVGEVMRRFSTASPDEQFNRLATIIGPDLADYYRERAREFGTSYNVCATKLIVQRELFVA